MSKAYQIIDVLTATAQSLQLSLRHGDFTSVDLVRTYMSHIKEHDDYLDKHQNTHAVAFKAAKIKANRDYLVLCNLDGSAQAQADDNHAPSTALRISSMPSSRTQKPVPSSGS